MESGETSPNQPFTLTISIPLYRLMNHTQSPSPCIFSHDSIQTRVRGIIEGYKTKNVGRGYSIYLVEEMRETLLERVGELHPYNNSVVVYFENQYSVLRLALDDIETELDVKEKMLKTKDSGGLRFKMSSKKSVLETGIDIAYVYANPLVKGQGECLSTNFQEVDILSDLSRIKKELSKNKKFHYNIQLSLYQATKENLKKEIRTKKRILHLLCNTEIDDQNSVNLALESSRLGVQQSFGARGLFSQVPFDPTNQIDLVVLVGRRAQQSARIVAQNLKHSSVMFVDTSYYDNDIWAQSFVSHFYFYLSEGNSVQTSFQNARQKTSNCHGRLEKQLCCCLHQHKSGCKFMTQVEIFGIETCHKRYHSIFIRCKCRTTKDYNLKSCPFGKKLHTIFNNTQISQSEICDNYCCCSGFDRPRRDVHKASMKIGVLSNGGSVIFKETDRVKVSEFIIVNNKESNFLCEPRIKFNENIFKLVECLSRMGDGKSLRVLNVFGRKKSGRGTLVRQSIRYMLKRTYSGYNFYQRDFGATDSVAELKVGIKETFSVSVFPEFQRSLDFISNPKFFLLLSNIDFLNKNNKEELKEFNDAMSQFQKKFPLCYIIAITENQLPISVKKNSYQIPPIDSTELVLIYNNSKVVASTAVLNLQDAAKSLQKISLQNRTYDKILSWSQEVTNFELKVTKNQQIKKDEDNKRYNLYSKSLVEFFNHQDRESERRVVLLLFQFQHGLTELDVQIMGKLDAFGKRREVVKSVVREIEQLFKEGRESGLMGYVDIQDNSFKVIKISEQCRQHLKNGDVAREGREGRLYRLIFLEYMSWYIRVMIRYLTQHNLYHQETYEFLQFPNIGFFDIQNKIKKFSSFPPFQKLSIDNALDSKNLNPSRKQIINTFYVQIDNMFSFYNIIDGEYLCQGSKFNSNTEQNSEERGYFKLYQQYIYSLLVEIPTLVIMMESEKRLTRSQDFLHQSWSSANRNFQYDPAAMAILLIQLKITELGVSIKLSQESPLALFQVFRAETQQILKGVINRNHSETISRVLSIQLLYIELYLRLEPGHRLGAQQQESIFQKIERIQSCLQYGEGISKIIMVPSLERRLCAYKVRFNVLLQSLGTLHYARLNLERQTVEAVIREYREKGRKWISFKMEIDQLESALRHCNTNPLSSERGASIETLTHDFKKLESKMDDQGFQGERVRREFKRVAEIFRGFLKNHTKNLMVYLRASPLDPDNEQEKQSLKNVIRSGNKYKKTMLEMFTKEKKELFSNFKVLTYDNLQTTLKHGCLLLCLVVDCEVDANENISMVFQNKDLPIKELKPVKEFRNEFYQSRIGIILVCGKNSEKFCKVIKRSNISECPLMISMDTVKAERSIQVEPFESPSKYLKRIITNQIQELYMVKFNQNLIRLSKTTEGDFNLKIAYISRKAYNSVYNYINLKYDIPNHYSDIKSYLVPRVVEGKGIALSLKESSKQGGFQDINMARVRSKNIEAVDEVVGRQQTILEICQFLTQGNQSQHKKQGSEDQSQISCLNLHGIKGVGKRTIALEVSDILVSRNYFENGVFLIDCQNVIDSGQGNILNYIEQHENYLLELYHKSQQEKGFRISILFILTNFQSIGRNENQEFFAFVERVEGKMLAITSSKGHEAILGKPLLSLEVRQMNDEETRSLVYSSLNINNFYRSGTIEEIERTIREGQNQERIPYSISRMVERMQKRASEEDKHRYMVSQKSVHQSAYMSLSFNFSQIRAGEESFLDKYTGSMGSMYMAPSEVLTKLRLVSMKKSVHDSPVKSESN